MKAKTELGKSKKRKQLLENGYVEMGSELLKIAKEFHDIDREALKYTDGRERQI